MGECATTSWEDCEKFVDCVLSTTRRRVPTFIGATALGTHEIIKRIRFAKERGATGTLLGIPMWQPGHWRWRQISMRRYRKRFPISPSWFMRTHAPFASILG